MGKIYSIDFVELVFFLNRDINMKSPYCKRDQCGTNERWLPIFPELNFIISKGKLIFIG